MFYSSKPHWTNRRGGALEKYDLTRFTTLGNSNQYVLKCYLILIAFMFEMWLFHIYVTSSW